MLQQNSKAAKKALSLTKVYFEVTSHCNFRCDFCPSPTLKRKAQHMELALFQKGVDEIAATGLADTIGFHVLGEPLLYPHLSEAIRYARGRGLHTEINTNGSLLNAERVAALIEAGLDELSISLQVVGEAQHASREAGMPYERYYARILSALRQVRAAGSSMEVIVCLMNTSTRKYFEIDQPWRLNGSAGSFRGNLEDLILDLAEPAGLVISREQARRTVRRLVLHQPQFIRLGNHTTVFAQPAMDWGNAFNSGKVYPAHIGACGYALRNLGVLSNGSVTICCGDYEGRTSLGNLGQQTFAEMLASPRVQAIQQGFERMRVVHPHCQHCLGSSQPVKALLKGVASVYLFHLLRFQPGGKTKEVQLQQAPNHVPEDIGPEMHAGRGQVARALEKRRSHQR